MDSTNNIDETLRDAAYAAIGIGVIAYHWSKPYRRRLVETAENLHQSHGEVCMTELKRGTRLLRDAVTDIDKMLFSRQ